MVGSGKLLSPQFRGIERGEREREREERKGRERREREERGEKWTIADWNETKDNSEFPV